MHKHFSIGILLVLSMLPQGSPRAEDSPTRELIGDPRFARGCILWEPRPGKHVAYGRLSGTVEKDAPVWGLAQWSSRERLLPGPPRVLEGGGWRYENAAKAVTFGRPGTADADVALAVHGGVEYGDRARKQGEPWVHLLLEQRFDHAPALSELTSAHFHIEARKNAFRKLGMSGYSPGLHAAQNQIFFTLANTNRASAGYGKLLWFGVPLFDDRERISRGYQAQDTATGDDSGMFIYTVPGKELTTQSLHDEGWVTLDKELLPFMRAGLEAAWKAGFLNESHSLSDYRITGMNMGWEVPGTFDVEIQYRNLSLKVTTSGTRPEAERKAGN